MALQKSQKHNEKTYQEPKKQKTYQKSKKQATFYQKSINIGPKDPLGWIWGPSWFQRGPKRPQEPKMGPKKDR